MVVGFVGFTDLCTEFTSGEPFGNGAPLNECDDLTGSAALLTWAGYGPGDGLSDCDGLIECSSFFGSPFGTSCLGLFGRADCLPVGDCNDFDGCPCLTSCVRFAVRVEFVDTTGFNG